MYRDIKVSSIMSLMQSAHTNIILSLLTLSLCRHTFFPDVPELRAQQQARNNVKLLEVLEMRQRQMEAIADKRRGTS